MGVDAQKWTQKLKDLTKKRGMEIVIAVVVVAVILIIYLTSWSWGGDDTKPPDTQAPLSTEESQSRSEDHAGELSALLSRLKGAGKVQVMITYESGPEIVPAFSTTEQSNQTSENSSTINRTTTQSNQTKQPVTAGGSGQVQAVVLKEIEPAIKGVIVLAEGAGDIRVKMNLLQAVQTVLQIDANQVDVFEMGKTQ
ncbi:MAG: hypothetical protein ACOX88_00895 [Christensenellales bacterium]|jgi:stage III sporulation protein AG